MSKDNTRYVFNGTEYAKNRLALKVIQMHSKENNLNYSELKQVFPMERMRLKIFLSAAEYDAKYKNSKDTKRRYFNSSTEQITTSDGDKIYVCNQWNIETVTEFIELAKNLGYEITPVQKEQETILALYQKYKLKPFSSWIQTYKDRCEQLAQYKNKSSIEIDREILDVIWKSAENGIGSVKPGFLSDSEYKALLPELADITAEILKSPTVDTLQKILTWADKKKAEGKFNRIKRVVINRVFAATNPEQYSTIFKYSKLKMFAKELNYQYSLNINLSGNWAALNIHVMEVIKSQGLHDEDKYLVNTFVWNLYEQLFDSSPEDDNEEDEDEIDDMEMPDYQEYSSLNTILYGPPGTGKTYYTIEAAVKAVEPSDYSDINTRFSDVDERRTELKNKYDELVKNKRIRFVTFHQSYGYEEFVEGLRARETVSGDISYETENGIFKKICKDAENNLIQSEQSIAELDEKYKFEDALEHFKNTIFDDQENFPLTESVSITFIEDNGFRYGGSTWKSSQIMKYDDLRLLYQNGVNTRQGIKNSNFVSGLAKQHASYFIKALEAIKAYIPENSSIQEQINKQNYCLVIDEINRGNISKIFGELITLIEPSKRQGKSEEIDVILPYSGDKFSVPKNLHIIGTMNTADRSLAMMDTALRRRFDFKEMMPKPELFEGCIIAGINLKQLLTTLNQRIEALYDREHTLGHAFLFPAYDAMQEGKEDKAFRELQSAFQNKITPLLEEYFYEDWNKIRLVLGDNQKQDKSLQFVRETKIEYNELFGDSYNAEEYGQPESRYELAPFGDKVWSNVEAYISIYPIESN